MGAQTNLLVKDDATSPVEYTFIPVTDTPIPFWRTAIANVPLQGQMRLYVSAEELKDGKTKVTTKLEVPVMETLGASGTSAGYVAPPKVAYTDTFYATTIIDPRSTIADRANLLKLGVGLAQGATATTATGTLANTAAGDTWKNSTAPIPLAHISVIIPN
jgi:hypothetical protein